MKPARNKERDCRVGLNGLHVKRGKPRNDNEDIFSTNLPVLVIANPPRADEAISNRALIF